MKKRDNTVTARVLVAMGFCDFICACYVFTSPNLQKQCNIFDTSFGVRHKRSCIKGGLVIESRNKVREEILYLT